MYCTLPDVRALQFTDLGEARFDLGTTCDVDPEAVMSLLYTPMFLEPAQVDAPTVQCMQRVATLGSRLVRVVTRYKRRMLDHIATHDMGPSQKLGLVNQMRRRMTAARDRIAALITEACPDFEAHYEQTVATFLVDLELRGDCIVFAGYIQSAVTCQGPVCGNRIKEATEQCEHGKQIPDDGCDNDCRRVA